MLRLADQIEFYLYKKHTIQESEKKNTNTKMAVKHGPQW